jgi:hypothetical protein
LRVSLIFAPPHNLTPMALMCAIPRSAMVVAARLGPTGPGASSGR